MARMPTHFQAQCEGDDALPVHALARRRLSHDKDPPELLREPTHHRPFWVRLLCGAGAVVMFALGVVGWLVPVITGIPFYLAGFALLALASDNARHRINRLEARLPRGTRWMLRHGLQKLPSQRLRSLFNLAHESSSS